MEQRLRPAERIGWNVAPGGHKPPAHKAHTAEAKRKIGEASRASAHTPAQIQARRLKVGVKRSTAQRERMKSAAAGRKAWNTSRAVTSVWTQADKFYTFFKNNPTISSASSAAMHGLKEYALRALYSKFKQSWKPLDDPEWVLWAQDQYLKEKDNHDCT